MIKQSPQQQHHHNMQQQLFHQQQQHQHQSQMEDSHSNEDSKSPHDPQSPSPFSRDSRSRTRKYDNDDISSDKVSRIYQEELAKLMTMGPQRDSFSRYLKALMPLNLKLNTLSSYDPNSC